MLKEKAPKVFTTLQQQLQTGTIHLKSRIFFFLYFGIVILTFEQKLTQSTASCMQFELKASMCESSTKLIPYMLITLKFGVALFNVLIFRSCYFSFVLFWLFLPDVEHLVDLPLLFLTLLIGSIKVEHLDPVDEVVDLLHEVVKEDRLAETHAQVLDLGIEDSYFSRFMSISWVITPGHKSHLFVKRGQVSKDSKFAN